MDEFIKVQTLKNSKSIKNLEYFTDANYGYNLDSGLRKIRYALANQDYSATAGVININVLGDSIWWGNNALDNTIANKEKAVIPMLRAKFAARYGDAGEGFVDNQYPVGADTRRWTYTGDWTSNGIESWANAQTCKKKATSVGATATLVFNGTGVRPMLQTNNTANPSTAEITIDGVLQDTVSLSNATIQAVGDEITGLTDGEHTLVITNTAGQTTVLGAYEITAATRGVRFNRFCSPGLNINDFVFYSAQMNATIDFLAPKLTIITLLANDFLDSVAIANFKADYQTLITRAKAQGDVLLVTSGGLFPTGTTTILIQSYIDTIYELARDNDVAVLDIFKRWGSSYTVANAIGYVDSSGHPTTKGHQDLANVVDFILTGGDDSAALVRLAALITELSNTGVDTTARADIATLDGTVDDITNDGQLQGFVVLTAAEYAALGTPDANTVYLITG